VEIELANPCAVDRAWFSLRAAEARKGIKRGCIVRRIWHDAHTSQSSYDIVTLSPEGFLGWKRTGDLVFCRRYEGFADVLDKLWQIVPFHAELWAGDGAGVMEYLELIYRMRHVSRIGL